MVISQRIAQVMDRLGPAAHFSIDIPHLQRKRDRMVAALCEIGYDVRVPEGTCYWLPRSPLPDDEAFVELLAEQNIFCLPAFASTTSDRSFSARCGSVSPLTAPRW